MRALVVASLCGSAVGQTADQTTQLTQPPVSGGAQAGVASGSETQTVIQSSSYWSYKPDQYRPSMWSSRYPECGSNLQSPVELSTPAASAARPAYFRIWTPRAAPRQQSLPPPDPVRVSNDRRALVLSMITRGVSAVSELFEHRMTLVSFEWRMPAEHIVDGVRLPIERQAVFLPSDLVEECKKQYSGVVDKVQRDQRTRECISEEQERGSDPSRPLSEGDRRPPMIIISNLYQLNHDAEDAMVKDIFDGVGRQGDNIGAVAGTSTTTASTAAGMAGTTAAAGGDGTTTGNGGYERKAHAAGQRTLQQANAQECAFAQLNQNQGMAVDIAAEMESIYGQDFFAYPGSLTHPPCTETVSWFVSKKVLPMNLKQLQCFQGALTSLDKGGTEGMPEPRPKFKIGDVGVARSIQPLNGRTVQLIRFYSHDRDRDSL